MIYRSNNRPKLAVSTFQRFQDHSFSKLIVLYQLASLSTQRSYTKVTIAVIDKKKKTLSTKAASVKMMQAVVACTLGWNSHCCFSIFRHACRHKIHKIECLAAYFNHILRPAAPRYTKICAALTVQIYKNLFCSFVIL